MDFYLIGIIIILFIIIIFLLCKIYLMKKSINEISLNLKKILETDTNNVISISTLDGDIKNLASSLNIELKTLREQKLQYENGNQELKESITNVSHDLRTPLTAISGYLELLNEEKLTEKQYKYVKIINNKTNELENLTEQLFDFSKSIDLGKNLNKENCCINDILEETIASYYKMFKEKNITPIIKICQKKIYKSLDKNMLIRVFENLISNAIRYSDNSYCNIELQENGKIVFFNKASKLDVTTVKKIFDRYYTVENAKKQSGVGLSIAKQLVELNKGSISSNYKNGCLIIELEF